MLDCYVINLDRDTKRWRRIEETFASVSLRVIRVPAIDVSQDPRYLEDHFFCADRFHRQLNRSATNGEIGCYGSHLKAMKLFLETAAPCAIIAEDDICPCINAVEILELCKEYSHLWDLLRLAKCRTKNFFPYTELMSGIYLGTNVTGFSYTAAYMINRRAAEFFTNHLVPMTLPYDLALFSGREEIREMSVVPGVFHPNEMEKESTICGREQRKIFGKHWLVSRFTKIRLRYVRYKLQRKRIRELQKLKMK
ncbi:MAG: glycosyltransferase family 25 protein [Planctomycetia bacterium]|nr:glycosyltransferase family 25 protein [Planctomycetia bacterium]